MRANLDDIGMSNGHQGVEIGHHLFLFGFELFPVGEGDLVPDDLDPVFHVHSQVGGVRARHDTKVNAFARLA